MSTSADRNLLFGILALHNDFISRDQLIAGMSTWAGEKHTPLEEILVRQGAMNADDRAALERMVDRRIERDGHDPAKSIAALSSVESSLKDALHSIADPVVDASLQKLAVNPFGSTATYVTVGATSQPGSRFLILRPHAKGGLGQVSIALDTELRREVALKEIQAPNADQPDSRSRFVLEAEITGGLEHPGVVPVYGMGHYADGRPFYAMKFIKGQSLKEAIERFHDSDIGATDGSSGALQLRGLLGRFLDVCQAMQYAHDRGVLHRDLKPGNIMLGKYGETLVVDWGLAKAHRSAPESQTEELPLIPTISACGLIDATLPGSAIGTPAYMSPEQAAGRLEELGPASDVYSLGATLFHILTGQPPLIVGEDIGAALNRVQLGDIPHPASIKPNVPRTLAAICRKAMALRPADRYETPQNLAVDIERYLADEPVSVIRDSFVVRMQRLARKNPGAASALAATVLVGVLGLTSGLYFVNAEKNLTSIALRDRESALRETETQRVEAIKSSALAAKRLNEKRTALDAMLTSFSDEQLKSQPGSQPVRKRFLEEGIAQYQRLMADNARDVEVTLQAANAYRELGVLKAEIGDHAGALETLGDAMNLCRQAVATKSSRVNLTALGNALYEVGQTCFAIGKAAESVPFAEESRTVFESLHAEFPKDPDLKARLGRALVLSVAAVPSTAATNQSLGRATTLLREAVKEKPDNAEYMTDLGRAIGNSAVGNADTGDVVNRLRAEAVEWQDKAINLQPTLAVAHTRKSRLVRNLTFFLVGRSQFSEALDLVDSALKAAREFAQDNPLVSEGQVALGDLLTERGSVLSYLTRNKEAVAAYEDAARTFEDLGRRFPDAENYTLRQIQSLKSCVGLVSEAEGVKILERIAQLADATMRRHPKSNDLAWQFLNTYSLLGGKLYDLPRLADAVETFEKGTQVYRDFASKVEMSSEDVRGEFLTTARFLVEAYQKMDEHEKLISKCREFLALVDLNSLTLSRYQDEYLMIQTTLGNSLYKNGQIRESLDVRIAVRDKARELLHGDHSSNWYMYARAVGAHHHIAEAARKVQDDRLEFDSLRAYFAETQHYFTGRDYTDLLNRTKVLSPESLADLRTSHKEDFGKMGMKRFSIPVEFSGVKYPFHIYIAENWDFTNDQFVWIEKIRGGKVPTDVKDSLKRIYDIAKTNKVSFQDLCIYALSMAAGGGGDWKRDLPIVARPTATTDPFEKVKELAKAKDEANAELDVNKGMAALLQKYAQFAEYEIGNGNSFRANYFLEDAQRLLDELKTRDQTVAVLQTTTYLNFLRAVATAVAGQFEQAQKSILAIYKTSRAQTEATRMIRPGACEFALAWTTEKLNRPVEALAWYLQAADANHPYAYQAVFLLYGEHPAIGAFVPRRLRHLIGGDTKERAAAVHFEELAQTPEQRLERKAEKLQAAIADYTKTADADTGQKVIAARVEVGMARLELWGHDEGETEFREAEKVLNAISSRLTVDLAMDKKKALENGLALCQLYRIATGKLENIFDVGGATVSTLLDFRAQKFSERGRLEEVEKVAELLKSREPEAAQNTFFAGRAYAMCATYLATSELGATAEGQQRHERYVRLALDCIKEAVGGGYERLDTIRDDKDLKALHGIPEFEALVHPKEKEDAMPLDSATTTKKDE